MRNLTNDGKVLPLLPELTITDAINATAGVVFTGLAGMKYLVAYARMKVGTGGTAVKAYVQTSLDGGVTWIDIMSFAFANTAGTKVSAVSAGVALAAALTGQDGALTDDTILDGLIGDRVRVKYVTTGTYAGGTSLTVSAVAKGDTRLIEREKPLATKLKERDAWTFVQTDLTRRLKAVPWNDEVTANNLKVALRQLRDGISPSEGVTIPVMSAMVGKPGLLRLEREIAQLTTEVEELRAHLVRWPSPTTRHPYKYIGPPHVTHLEGRDLEPGDVVQLGENWAADTSRFQPVDEAPTSVNKEE